MIRDTMVSACTSSNNVHTLVEKPNKPFAQLSNGEWYKDQSVL